MNVGTEMLLEVLAHTTYIRTTTTVKYISISQSC